MVKRGTIAVEEAIIDPGSVWTLPAIQHIMTPGKTDEAMMTWHRNRLLDIHDKRLATMDAEGVEYMLLSLTSPGCQGQHDKNIAEKMATDANNYLQEQVAKNPARFGALAAVSMHDPDQAAKELTRAVKELGFFGGLVNDYQSTGADGRGRVYFDEPKFDIFWKTVQELDVPIYFHPRWPIEVELEPNKGNLFGDRLHLLGAAVQFHLDLSLHLYMICSSGILDRYPKVQIVAGHLGEGIPFNLWRADHWYNTPAKKAGRPSKEDYTYYFKHNVHITTSGFFSTKDLKFCIDLLGVDRCLYSIDTPYEKIEEAQEWWRSVDLPDKEKEQVARSNAIKLFKLPLEL